VSLLLRQIIYTSQNVFATFIPMKNLAGIWLLIIYTTSQVGSILIYYHRPVIHAISSYRQQRRVRDQKEVIKDTVISKKAYLANIHENGEIMLNGILHDIKYISFTKEQVHLRLLADESETKWINNFSSVLNALQDHHPRKLPLQLWSWLFKIYPCESQNGSALASTLVVNHNRVSNPYLPSCFLSFRGQPPEGNV